MKTDGIIDKLLIIVVLCILVVIIAPHVNRSAGNTGTLETAAGNVRVDTLPTGPAAVEPPPELVFDDPSQYGIITPDEWGSMPTEDQIRATISTQIRRVKAETPPELWKKIAAEIDEPAEDVLKKVAFVDEKIQEYKTRLESDPFDQRARSELEMLYMLRVMAEEMNPNVPPPVHEPASELNNPPQQQAPAEPEVIEVLIEE